MIEVLDSLDQALFLLINSFHVQWLNPIMTLFSGQLIWIPLVIYFIWNAFKSIPRREAWIFILFVVLVLVASDVTSSYIIKNLTHRLRPCRDLDLKPVIYDFGQRCGGKFGFVSSHAANSFGLTLFCLSGLSISKKWWPFFFLAPFLVAYSRIYLGVHFPGDVIGGMIIGCSWAYFFSWVFKNHYGAKR